MNRDQFLQYLSQPEHLDQASLEDLQELLSAFPYFPTGHLLLLKNLHNIRSIRFDSQLKVSSIFTHDRGVLYSLLHQTPGQAEEIPLPATETEEASVMTDTLPEESGIRGEEPGKMAQPPAEEEVRQEDEPEVMEEVQPDSTPETRTVGSIKETPEETPEKTPEKIAEETTEEIAEETSLTEAEEESMADRVLREVEEARRRIREGVPETDSETEAVAADQETAEKNEDQATDSQNGDLNPKEEIFILAEELADDIPQADTAAVEAATGEILEIDEAPVEPAVSEQEPTDAGTSEGGDKSGESPVKEPDREQASGETPAREKKTPDAGAVGEKHLSESHSFSHWIELLSDQEKTAAAGDNTPETGGNRQNELIDRFLEINPRIVPRQEEEEQEDISLESGEENDGMFTDTLAKIYVRQGYYSKAIFAYEKLSLKFPEKSSYFVAQMEKIQALIKQKSK